MIFQQRYLVLLVMALWVWGKPIPAQGLFHDFENLFERCRLSIETSSEFNSGGLERLDVPEGHERDWGMSSTQDAWAPPASALYVLLTQWTSRDGNKRHLCDIRLIDEEHVLQPSEQALLLRYFLIRQVELIGAGTHKADTSLAPIPPAVNAAFLLVDRNPNECVVTNTFAFSPDGTFFSAGSGEQAVMPCEAE